MENARTLAAVVLAWVGAELPGQTGTAEHAARIAERAYIGGATVDQACREAVSFLDSWRHHPSQWKKADHGVVALAS